MADTEQPPRFAFRLSGLFVFMTIVAVAAWLSGTSPIAVFFDRFELSIAVNSEQQLDAGELRFAYCWTPDQVENAMKYGDQGGIDFNPAIATHQNEFTVLIAGNGEQNIYGRELSYREPRWIVIQYPEQKGATDRTATARFAIPPGRGDRAMTIQLPTKSPGQG